MRVRETQETTVHITGLLQKYILRENIDNALYDDLDTKKNLTRRVTLNVGQIYIYIYRYYHTAVFESLERINCKC